MVAAGFAVPRPRATQEPFHTTIGVVNPAVCPAAALLSALSANVTDFSPEAVYIEAFDLAIPPVHVAAHNDTLAAVAPTKPRTTRVQARRR